MRAATSHCENQTEVATLERAFRRAHYLSWQRGSRLCFKFRAERKLFVPKDGGNKKKKKKRPFICCLVAESLGGVSGLLSVMESLGAPVEMLGKTNKRKVSAQQRRLSRSSDPFPRDYQPLWLHGREMCSPRATEGAPRRSA